MIDKNFHSASVIINSDNVIINSDNIVMVINILPAFATRQHVVIIFPSTLRL